MSPRTIKRIIAATVGIVFALVYGFWTMLLTGGGHGNFIWFWMFLVVDFIGLYFPLMAVLAVNLRSFGVKVVFGSLIAFNLIASTVLILGWITDTEIVRQGLTEFERTTQINGMGWLIVEIVAHFLPALIFAFLLVRSILVQTPAEHDEPFDLQLH